MEKKPHKIYLIVDKETYLEFRDTIQWGLRNALIVAVLKIITAAVKKDGMMVVGAVLAGKYKLAIDHGEDRATTGRPEEISPPNGP